MDWRAEHVPQFQVLYVSKMDLLPTGRVPTASALTSFLIVRVGRRRGRGIGGEGEKERVESKSH